MRFKSIAVSAALALLTFSAACKKNQPAPDASAQNVTAAPAAGQTDTAAIRGAINEKIDAGQYWYLKLNTASGEVWAAVLKTDKKVGDQVAVVNVAWMENFTSPTIKRTWERIAFGALAEAGGAGAGATTASTGGALPPGHPATAGGPGPGMFAPQAAGTAGGVGGAHPSPTAPADLGVIKVAKAPGPQGRTVADVYSQKATLKDKTVAVRGKVVKATNGVLGKNWLHLRDGSGQGAASDLSVSSSETASVGSTVVVTGVVHLDKDLGAGYRYEVIVEDAKIKAE
jgi:uncharacterized protein YdeI (BOF family)